MFSWEKTMELLAISANRVVLLHRSLSEVQVALPGVPSQSATAYACAYIEKGGLRVTVVFHLHDSHCLAFYLNDGGGLTKQQVGPVFSQALNFAESMGFIMGDLEISQFDAQKRIGLWDSLPLKFGVKPPQKPIEPQGADSPEPAAFSGGGTTRIAARRPLPSAEEMAARRRCFIENLGRFLASL